jgi:hypothetical protein
MLNGGFTLRGMFEGLKGSLSQVGGWVGGEMTGRGVCPVLCQMLPR